MEQRIDVYDGNDDLAARFVFGQAPDYFGAAGQAVKALAETPRGSFNPWRTESHQGGLRDDDYTWLVTTVCQAVAQTEYRTEVYGAPYLESEPGVIYDK